MPYRFLDDVATADIAFEATGKNMDELFGAAADATLAVMLEDISGLRPQTRREVRLTADDPAELLFGFLQELIFYKDAECLLLKVADVTVEPDGSGWCVTAALTGEPVDIDRHRLNVDVKAVTYHRYKFLKTDDGYQATVVLDI